MDSSGKNLETHVKKIVIPDGSIKPNETVIIEVPPEFQSNRTFLATRGNPNLTYPTTQPTLVLPNATFRSNRTRTQNPNVTTTVPNTSERANQSLLGQTYGSLNSSYGSKNSSGRSFAPQFTSTPKKSPQYKEPTLNYSLNVTPQHSYKVGGYQTIDPSEPSSFQFSSFNDSSSGNIDDSLMGKILRGEIGRVLVWPTPPSQRVNTTYNLQSGTDTSSWLSSGNQLNSGTPSNVSDQVSKEYTNRVHLTNGNINLTYPLPNARAQSKKDTFNTTTNYNKFAPPFTSTTTKTKYGGFNYTGNLPPKCFQKNTTYVATPSTTSLGTYTCCSSDNPLIETPNSENVTYSLDSDGSNMFIPPAQYKKLTCASYGNSSKDKKVTFEQSTTTVQTYREESETDEAPRVIQTVNTTNTRTTGARSSEIPFLQSGSTVCASHMCQTVDLNGLTMIEERERTQLENDLRRVQEARRQLAKHVAEIGSVKLL